MTAPSAMAPPDLVAAALALPLPVCVVDSGGSVVGASAAFATALGGRPGSSWHDLAHPDDAAAGPVDGPCRLRTPRGDYRWSALRVAPLEHAPGCRLVVVVDVHEALAERAALRTIFEQAPVGMSVVDRDFRYLRLNRRLAEIDGSDPSAVAGTTVESSIPDLWPTIRPLYDRVLGGEVVEDVHTSGTTAAAPGRLRHWRVGYYPLRDEAGEVAGIGSVVVEETERWEVEARAHWLASVVEQSRDVIALMGTDLRLEYLNPAGCAVLGVDAERAVGADARGWLLEPPGLAAERDAAMQRDGHWEGVTWLQPRDDVLPVPYDAECWYLLRPGQRRQVVCVMRDARERLAAEQHLAASAELRARLLERAAAAAEDERRRISEDIHDDSLQALAAVDLRLGALRRRMGDAGEAELLALDRVQAAMRDATARLRDLVFRLEPPGRHEPFASAMRTLLEPLVEGSGTALEVRGGEDLPPVPEAVRTAVFRVVREAVANALKHAGAAHLVVVLAVEGRRLVVDVEDDGRGLPAGVSSRPGHLGLVAMRERTTMVGGELHLGTRPGGGARVRLSVPLAP